MNNEGLLHELWEHTEGGMALGTFVYAGPAGDAARNLLPADAKLVWTVWAVSHFEAMTRYYEWKGWGAYTTNDPGASEPYTLEEVQEQQRFFAGL